MKLLKSLVLGAFLSLFPAATPAADFSFNVTNHVLSITGEIVASDLDLFYRYTSSFDVTAVRLDSPGGDFYAGINIGMEIHDSKIGTIVSGDCFSACAYMWLAGDPKMFNVEEDNIIGIHMPAKIVGKIFESQPITTDTLKMETGWYLGYIGATHETLIATLNTPFSNKFDDLLLFTVPTMIELGITPVLPWKNYERPGR